MFRMNRVLIGLSIVLLIITFLVMIVFPGVFGYLWHTVNSNQIGIVEQYGQVQEVVGPGTYTDPMRWRADIHNVTVSAIPFAVTDQEVLTKGGEQAVGVTVAGDVFRPNLLSMPRENALRLWQLYRPLMQNDEAVLQRISVMAQQAMKECVGDRTFEQAAVGSGRDDLRTCIDTALEDIGSEIGFGFQNVSVPNIILSEAQQLRIAEINNARTAIQLSNTQAEQVVADGKRDAARAQAEAEVQIAPTQAYLEARATQAVLELNAITSENEAQKAALNAEREQAQIQLDIQRINAEISLLTARVQNANVEQLAVIMQNYPEYAAIIRTEKIADMLSGIEIMYLPSGTNPLLAMGYQQLTNGVFTVISPDVTPTPVQ